MTAPTPRCHGKSDLFDAVDQRSHAKARELCGVCPLIDACRRNLKAAQRDVIVEGHGPEGTWAGVLLKPRSAA